MPPCLGLAASRAPSPRGAAPPGREGGRGGGFPRAPGRPSSEEGGGGEPEQAGRRVPAPRLTPQMGLCHRKGKRVRSRRGEGQQGRPVPARSAGLGFLQPGGAESLLAGRAGGQGHSGPSRSVTRACLCSSPDVSPAPPSLRTGPSRGAVPPSRHLGPRSGDSAAPGGRRKEEIGEARAPAPPPCAAPPTMCQSEARRGPEPARRNGESCPRPRPAAPSRRLPPQGPRSRPAAPRRRWWRRQGARGPAPAARGPTPGGQESGEPASGTGGGPRAVGPVSCRPLPRWAQLQIGSLRLCREQGGREEAGVEE